MYCLPEQYTLQHDYCMYLHNFLVKIIVEGEKESDFLTDIKLTDEQMMELSSDDIDIWEWLIKNNKKNELGLACIKMNFVALLSEFCQYIHAALECSAKGHLSATYTLLRKPFKDIMLLIEWMIADPLEFANLFIDEDINLMAVDKISRNKKISIITKANERSSLKSVESDYLYDVRYDKQCFYGLEGLFQKANHIITSNKNYKTEDNNFNFIFSNFDDKVAQWNKLYLHLPLLMNHMVGICDTMYYVLSDKKISEIDLEKIVNMFLEISKKSCKNEFEAMKIHKSAIPMTCEYCGVKTKLAKNWLKHDDDGYWYRCKNGHINHIF